jgi:hypothetical protein
MFGTFSARSHSEVAMATNLSAEVMIDFNAPAADKSDDEGELSTTDPFSQQVSSDSEDGSDDAVEEARIGRHKSRGRLALDGVLASLPHFREACVDESDEDDDIVLSIAQSARRLALGGEANA